MTREELKNLDNGTIILFDSRMFLILYDNLSSPQCRKVVWLSNNCSPQRGFFYYTFSHNSYGISTVIGHRDDKHTKLYLNLFYDINFDGEIG
jgi:hypothetical protein